MTTTTGFTNYLNDDPTPVPSLKEFLFVCARATGPCVHLRDRDEPSVEVRRLPIPLRQPSSSLARRHSDAQSALSSALARSDEEWSSMYATHVDEVKNDRAAMSVSHTRIVDKLTLLRARVENWEPPTPDHVALKNFALQQIDISMPKSVERPDLMMPVQDRDKWVANEIAWLRQEALSTEESVSAERKLIQRSNAWIEDLIGSLPAGS